MQQRRVFWIIASVLLVAALGVVLWRDGRPWPQRRAAIADVAVPPPTPVAPTARTPARAFSFPATPGAAVPGPNLPAPFERHVRNMPASFEELKRSDRAILLRNATIDTSLPLALNLPERFRAPADTRTYIVQSRGVITEAFRAMLRGAGARIVDNGYIPNNASLVRVPSERVAALAASPLTQAVLPFEPFYKLDERLLRDGPVAEYRALGYPGEEGALRAALRGAGAELLGEERLRLGTIYTFRAPDVDVAALARIDELQLLEPKAARRAANDLTRVLLGVAPDTTSTTNNYLGLTGTNVLLAVADTGVDTNHPDLAPRALVDVASTGTDPSGHGSHVAGIAISSGEHSTNVVASGSVSNANFQGKAPGARVFMMRAIGFDEQSDAYLQETAAGTNASIMNNSWGYVGAFGYDLAAASYDAATRDAQALVTGSQPLLPVFAAGDAGFGNNNGLGGEPGGISSPGTAKNVITVGMTELPRNITNEVLRTSFDGITNIITTNQLWLGPTDSSNQVAWSSSRGNTGAGTEGDRGRFKPDVVAPGEFVVSTRPSDWDVNSYYNPTNYSANRFRNLILEPGGKFNNSVFLLSNTVGLIVQVLPNVLSPVPFPDFPIYVRQAGIPTTTLYDVVGTNLVSLPPDHPLDPVGASWSYSVVNPGTNAVSVDVRTIILTTNNVGDYYTVLSNLNETLDPGHLYRYESGSSMSAAAVSGTLLLMEEFFEQRMQPLYSPTNRPSPALLKALLINGARSLGPIYNFSVSNLINYQGWGLVNLPNSLPASFSNLVNQAGGQTNMDGSLPMVFFDQNPTNALVTGQSRTRRLQVNDEARLQPLRITLVWTDPPGNPAAGPKLVNDLDLIVTNLDTLEVFYGNDIPEESDFNLPSTTNGTPGSDVINNVENVFLNAPIGTNYAVTVLARRVNVNAVTAQTNGIAQDYALVISSGDGGSVTNAFTVTDNNEVALTNQPQVTVVVTNGVPLLAMRVGANDPMLTTTNGNNNQWHFFVYTNATAFTNVAFVTFLPPELSVPRIGVQETDLENATRVEADIDLYVSRNNPALTNLDAVVIAGSLKSLNRGGTEAVILTDAVTNEVFYIGVKSEDQMAAEFGFFGVSSELPFSSLDANGNQFVRGLSLPMAIPDGSPGQPGGALVFGLAIYPMEVRKVVVTNTVMHEGMGDLLGHLSHGQKFSVLNNHRPSSDAALGPFPFVYDDSGEYPIPGAQPTDGPGSLRSFAGEEGAGVWMLTMVDNALNRTGRVDELSLLLELSLSGATNATATIQPHSFYYDVINVPPEATNLTLTIGNMTPALPVELYLRKGNLPTRTVYDKFTVINPPAGSLSVSLFDVPPLTAGRYYFGIYNPNDVAVTVDIGKQLDLAARPNATGLFNNASGTPLSDDAVTRSSITVTNDEEIARVQVGLLLQHERVSDVAVTLISPSGTRILLTEDRGGLTTGGYGNVIFTTNVAPASSSGGPAAATNTIAVGANLGTLLVDYDFFTIPDQMQVLYDGAVIFDTSLISGANNFSLNFGPGSATDLTIVMNPTNNAATNTIWTYTASVISTVGSYAVFTENAALNPMPIKFAVPPFAPVVTPPVMVPISGFETNAGTYTNGMVFDGWAITNTQVTVINDPALADSGTNFLALASGQISRTLPTQAGKTYRLSYAYRGPNIISWWRGESNANDNVGTNNGTLQGGLGFAAGEVDSGFSLDGVDDHIVVSNAPALNFGAGADFSIDAWIKPEFASTDFGVMTILDKRLAPNLTDSLGYTLWLQDGQLAFQMADAPLGPFGGTNFVSLSPYLFDGNFHHVAVSVDRDSTTGGKLVVDGTVVLTFDPTSQPGDLSNSEPMLIGKHALFNASYFKGIIDEISLYSRALSDSEIKAIYAAGGAGKFDQFVASPANLSKARLTLGTGQTNITFGDNAVWKTNNITFTASQTGTTLALDGLEPGMLLDSFTLTEVTSSSVYYLPEESLSALIGENALGIWTLEVWDTRAGASNNAPQIAAWQLDLAFANTQPLAQPLYHAQPVTNNVGPHSTQYYFVDVPLWATFATNSLFNLSPQANLNLIFNYDPLPTLVPGDFPLLATDTNASITLAFPGIPFVLPGTRYYLAVQNTNATSVNYTVEVAYDITLLSNAVSLVTTQAALHPRYFAFDVSTNAAAVVFETFNADGNVDLFIARAPELPSAGGYDYFSANPGTNNEFILVSTNSSPVPLTPGRWHIGAFNQSPANVGYTIRVTELLSLDPNIIGYQLTSNSLCLTWTSVPGFNYFVVGKVNLTDPGWVPVSPTILAADVTTTYCIPLPTPYQFFRIQVGTAPTAPQPGEPTQIPAGGIAYFAIPVPDWPYAATNTLVSSTLPVDLLFNQNGLPTGAAGDDLLLTNQTAGVFTLRTNSTPALQTNRTYYLGLRNTNASAVTALLQVEFNVTVLTNGAALNDTLLSAIPRYFTLDVPSNSVTALFELYNLGGNADLVIREDGFGLPTLTSFDYGSFNPGTNAESIMLTTNTAPFPLTINKWNLSVYNRTAGPVAYTVRATASPPTNPPPVIVDIQITSSNLCLTWTSIPGEKYYVIGKTDLFDPNWSAVSPTIIATTNLTTYCVSLPSPYHYFRVVLGPRPAFISIVPAGGGGFALTWEGPYWTSFQVQWADFLPPAWTPFTNIITATITNGSTGTFQFTDDGSQTGGIGPQRFYQLLQLP